MSLLETYRRELVRRWPNYARTCRDVLTGSTQLHGKTVLLTCGIDAPSTRILTYALASSGAHVVLGTRDRVSTQRLLDDVVRDVPGSRLEKALEHPVDVIVHNAQRSPNTAPDHTVWMQRTCTMTYSVTAPTQLTYQLLTQKKLAPEARVLYLTTDAHRMSRSFLPSDQYDMVSYTDKGQSPQGVEEMDRRAQLCALLTARALGRHVPVNEVRFHAVSIGPDATLLRKLLDTATSNDAVPQIVELLQCSAEQQAATLLWAAVTPELTHANGCYIERGQVVRHAWKADPIHEGQLPVDDVARVLDALSGYHPIAEEETALERMWHSLHKQSYVWSGRERYRGARNKRERNALMQASSPDQLPLENNQDEVGCDV